MKQLTLTEALQECSKMWHWLAENPSKEKLDYYRDALTKLNDIPLQECNACEYTQQQKALATGRGLSAYCDYCPIFYLWPNKCTHKVAAFDVWCHSSNQVEVTNAAKQIAEFCDQELARIKESNETTNTD